LTSVTLCCQNFATKDKRDSLGVGIDPGMALTPLPSSIGQGLNPQPFDCEPSALPLDHSFHFGKSKLSFFALGALENGIGFYH